MNINKFFLVLLLIPLLYSCKVYKSNIMFKTNYDYVVDSIRKANLESDKNFIIARNDYITIKVYTHNGERIIDPDYELLKSTGIQTNNLQNNNDIRYIVRQNGKAFLPMVGDIKVEGYTIRQCDSLLSIEYGKYYYNVFVNTKIANKRVVVLGALGGKVIPLENDNISVIEAIALYGGVNNDSKAGNIRLIRGDLKKPDVSIINLSTIEGMKKATLSVEPNDIIYIEPVRRRFPQFLQDMYPVLSVVSSVITTILLIANLNKKP
ncbi:MAG TPA: polysaccharide biosynthesis/export family protein [Cytophagaceae bacterium]|jgi:polysaccharide export outer membrane protein|nr:polysaccharide biosynthesis/export family protein [Cytophagaceae bacterium]